MVALLLVQMVMPMILLMLMTPVVRVMEVKMTDVTESNVKLLPCILGDCERYSITVVGFFLWPMTPELEGRTLKMLGFWIPRFLL